MTSLVEQLQTDAMNLSVPVVNLLLKTKALATKLDLQELLEWANRELSGYAQTDDIPPYRMVQGEYKVWNPYHGWQPILFPKSVKIPATRGVTSAIGEIEGYSPRKGEEIAVSIRPEEKARLVAALEIPMDVAWLANSANVQDIPGKVRNFILEWSLKLEKLGIKGDGLSFSPADKTKAEGSSITIGSIQNFAGNIGQAVGQSSIQATQTNTSFLDLDAVRKLAVQINEHADDLPAQSSSVIRHELKDLDEELQVPAPNQSKVRAVLGSIKRALEGAAGNLIASGILAELAKILPH
jgi:AbiTii